MAKITRKSVKPLQVNPHKLSQPMGATLAFLGVDRCMPLMHGGQGCTSFTKVFYTRHFCEPIALQTTAVTDVTAVLDGGDYSIVESIKNIRKKVTPELIGLYATPRISSPLVSGRPVVCKPIRLGVTFWVMFFTDSTML